MRGFFFIVAACSLVACAKDPVGPRSGITLLVTNATCVAGACDSVRILAFPSNQPDTPAGLWSVDLGVMTTQQKCFILPPSAKFYVIEEPGNGASDTTTFVWTTRIPVSIGAQAPGANFLFASPTTTAFTPTSAAGWAVALPTDSSVTAGAPCTQ